MPAPDPPERDAPAPIANPVASLTDVSLRYGKVVALDAIALDLPAGRMVGLLGPDGVGKSSLLALLSGARAIQEGRVHALGGDMASARHRGRVCPRISYMPQGLGKNLYPTLSIEEMSGSRYFVERPPILDDRDLDRRMRAGQLALTRFRRTISFDPATGETNDSDDCAMKTYLDCYPCFLRQALSAARQADASVELQRHILLETMDQLRALPAQATPPVMAEIIHRTVRRETHTPDPYARSKRDATAQAMTLLPGLRERVRGAPDPLETAVRIAIAGNIIDDGMAEPFDLEANLARVLEQPFAIEGLTRLREALKDADSLLYLADNAGETVFDRVLIECLALPVTYVVKAGPIINDATREDALAAGLDAVSHIIDNGSDAPGTLLEHCSAAFREQFAQAPLILAKGQASYETLSETRAPVFFLLQAKCFVIADDLGVPVGSVVLKACSNSLTDSP